MKPDSPIVTQAIFGKIVSYLAQVKDKDGQRKYSPTWITEHFGNSPNNRTRIDMMEVSAEALK